MVYENVNVNQTMPYYQFYQQPMQMPLYYQGMYEEQPFYYQSGGYMYQPMMNTNGYIPPYANNAYMPNYPNEANYAPNTYYSEPAMEEIASNRVMQQFLDENGQVDIQKMLRTVGQFADTVQQVSPVIKQLNDLIRSFRA